MEKGRSWPKDRVRYDDYRWCDRMHNMMTRGNDTNSKTVKPQIFKCLQYVIDILVELVVSQCT